MTFEEKFSKQISDFERYGTYTYEYDEVGNVIFDSSSDSFSEVYLALPVTNFIYNNDKIESFYDSSFLEFIPTTETDNDSSDIDIIKTELDETKLRNEELSKQLESLTMESESSETIANREATKQVILELRKSLGQGRVDSDFSEDFPYTPIKKPTNIASD